VTGLHDLRALETQINEFGQTPKQLFTHPHPPRLAQPPAPDPATVFTHGHSAEAAAAAGASSSSPEPAGGLGRQSPALPSPPGRAINSSSSSNSASKVRLKGGGEDAAGGAICFALLSTILAAAAPEIEPAAAAAAAAAAGDGGRDGVLQLSPVSSGDLSSAAPCSTSPAKGAAAQARQLARPALSLQQQGTQGAAGRPAAPGQGLRGMLSKLTEGAAAAAGSAAATVASAMQNSASSGSSGRGGLPLLPAGADGKPGGSMLASLSWMQQQLAEGLSLRSGSSSSSLNSCSNVNMPLAAQGAERSSVSSPSKGTAGAAGGSASSSSKPWPKNLPEKLLVRKFLKLQSDPLTAVAAAPDGSALFVAGHNGLLRVLDTSQLATHRSMKLENTDLLCISLLPTAAAGAAAATGVGAVRADSPVWGTRAGWDANLPLLLAGAQNGHVLAYAATAGRMVGSWAAHDDAVPSVLQLGHSNHGGAAHGQHGAQSSRGEAAGLCKLVTASWDCSVKVWDVAEGRQPWSSTLPLPSIELRDLDSGVWALSASASGQLLVTGTEEGVVSAWDLRTRQQIWSTLVR
jgi:hypothetical protein